MKRLSKNALQRRRTDEPKVRHLRHVSRDASLPSLYIKIKYTVLQSFPYETVASPGQGKNGFAPTSRFGTRHNATIPHHDGRPKHSSIIT